jgi:hypothetical protein
MYARVEDVLIMSRIILARATIHEAAYYDAIPELTRLFMSQPFDVQLRTVRSKVVPLDGAMLYYITATSDLHTYSVCFVPEGVRLHRERRQRVRKSRYGFTLQRLGYEDPELLDRTVNILYNWLKNQKRYYRRIQRA